MDIFRADTEIMLFFRPAKGLARPLDSLVAEAYEEEEPLSSFFSFASFFPLRLSFAFFLLRLFFFRIFFSFTSFSYIPEGPR